MIENFKKQLGQRIKSYREKENMSREDLAFEVGVSASYIGMIERAEYDFKISKLYKIAQSLNISLSELLSDL